MAPVYGVYFDEGPGYILVDRIGSGVDGQVHLVRSMADNCLYVRKEEKRSRRAKGAPIRSGEATNAMRITSEHTTNVQGWVTYQCQKSGDLLYVTYWNYCNAGTMYAGMKKATVYSPFSQTWVANFLAQMLTTFIDIHKYGVAHTDAHLNNWFLHRRAGSRLRDAPTLQLGGFGRSETKENLRSATWDQLCRADFNRAVDFLDEITRRQRLPSILTTLQKEITYSIKSAPNTVALNNDMRRLASVAERIARTSNEPDGVQINMVRVKTTPAMFLKMYKIELSYHPAVLSLKVYKLAAVTGPDSVDLIDGKYAGKSFELISEGGFRSVPRKQNRTY